MKFVPSFRVQLDLVRVGCSPSEVSNFEMLKGLIMQGSRLDGLYGRDKQTYGPSWMA